MKKEKNMNKTNLSEVVLSNDIHSDDVVLRLLSDNEYVLITQRLLSRNHTAFLDGKVAPPHYHNCYEIEILIGGTISHTVQNKKYVFEPYSYIMLSPNDIHGCELTGDTAVVLNIQFKKDIMSEAVKSMLECAQFPIFGKLSDELIEFIGKNITILQAAEKSMNNTRMYHKLLHNTLEGLLLYIIDTNNSLNINFEKLDDKRNTGIFKSISYIKENFNKQITINEVAEICGYTPNYFSSKFKEITGNSFVEYINNERLVYAYNHILMTNETIQSICSKSGFGDLKHFYNCFSKKFGCTPGSLRKS